ncbi:MAG: hypothetical protein KBD31_01390 [Proteobacteria bacterium]|nr:hypothetical protein [Pseudomonadota bacterium]
MLKHSIFQLLSKVKSAFIRSPITAVSLKNREFILQKTYNAPWPGDSFIAQNFLHGRFDLGHKILSFADFMNALATPDLLDNQTLLQVHSFEWIKDLRCISDNMSRRLTRQLIDQWIEHNGQWNKNITSNAALEPHIMGCRLSNWISCFDFFGASADEDFLIRFKKTLIFQYNILSKQFKNIADPIQKLMALKGLIFVATLLKDETYKVSKYLECIEELCNKQILNDGGHITRDPVIHFYILRDLVDIRSLIRLFHLDDAEFLNTNIQKMVPILRLFRHGDGTLAEFLSPKQKLLPLRGAPSQAYIDMVLSIADIKGRPPGKAPDMGYERINTKSGQVIINVKPQIELTERFFGPGTGILNFEWGLGKNKNIQKGDVLIQIKPNHWVQAPIGKDSPQVMKIDRQLKEGKYLFEADFESVIAPHKLDKTSIIFNHQRQLYLGGEEGDLRGQDRLLLSVDCLAAVRFVFAKGIEVTSISSSNAYGAIIRIPQKDVQTIKKTDKKAYQFWRLISSPVQEVYIHKDDELNQTAVLLVQNITADKPNLIKWAFHLTA